MPISWFHSVLLAAMLVGESAALADGAGSVRLTLQGSVAAYESADIEVDGAPASSRSISTFSLLDPALGATVAYSSLDTLAFGLHASFRTRSVDYDADGGTDPSASSMLLLPFVEYAFSPGAAARPYLEALVGLQTHSEDDGAIETSGTSFVYGAGFGFHFFPVRSFSIDPELLLLGTTGSAGPAGSDTSLDVSSYAVTLLLGFSGWLGGEDPRDAPPPEEPAASPFPAPSPLLAEPPAAVLSEAIALAGARLTLRSGTVGAVAVEVVTLSPEPRLAGCPQLTFTAASESADTSPVRYEVHLHEQRVEERLFAEIPAAALARFSGAGAGTVGCGSIRWPIEADALQRVVVFAARLQRFAPPPAPAPAPEQPAVQPAPPLDPSGD